MSVVPGLSMDPFLKQFGAHEWLCKTNFSFLIGASHPEDIIKRAIDLNYQSICINDFDGVYGLARTYLALKSIKKHESHIHLKLNFGAEIHFSKDHDLPVVLQDTLVLVAINWRGYHQLCSLLTYAHRDGKAMANIPVEYLLASDVSGLAAIQPMRGVIRTSLENSKISQLYDLFDGRFYFAISRFFHRSEDQWLKRTLKLGERLGAQFLLSQDVFFHHRSEKNMSDLLNAIRTNKKLGECQAYHFPNGERSFIRASDFCRFYHKIPVYQSALAAACRLNQLCQFDLSELTYHYPKEMIPASHTAQSFLEEMTWSGAKERFGKDLPTKVVENLKRELVLIQKLDFADYFLTVWDIVCWARSKDILCQGRGSAANSSVCYVLGITAVNPALFDLLFERFISMERGDPPDIDVDFEHERREEVIQYIYQRYGRKRAAMVANVITFRGKGAMRSVGKALDIDAGLIDKMSKLSSSIFTRSSGVDNIIQKTVENDGNNQLISNQLVSMWIRLAEKLKGFPRHMGIHSGGFVLTDKPLDCLVPQEPATMAGRTVIQWAKADLEGLGFFKIDILSLGMLTAIRKCFAAVNQQTQKSLTLWGMPKDDPETYAMMQKANTVGTFQVESRAQMSMLPRLQPKCFYDIVIEIAIIRPGPIQGGVIHPYLARRNGQEPVTYPDERLRPILSRTLGVAIFQEQAMRIAIAVGDFTPGEADELRKNIGSWNNKEFCQNLDPMLQKLTLGMKKRGIKDFFIQQIVGQMKGFADYGFPESHAISFALIAYASCYLKCHFPAQFFIAVLNSHPMGFYSVHSLLQAAKHDQVKILPISINVSCWDNTLEQISEPGQPLIYAIRLGFRLVTALSEKSGRALEKQRKKQESDRWESFDQFIQSVNLYRDDFTALASANVFQEFGMTRFDAIWQAEAVPFRPMVEVEEKIINWKTESVFQEVQKDFESFNTTLLEHPAYLLKKMAWNYVVPSGRLTCSSDLKNILKNRQVWVFGMMIIRQSPATAKGMVFVTIEDETGFFNLVFSPDIYAKYHHIVDYHPFLCVSGKLQRANEYHSVLVQKVYAVNSTSSVIPLKKRVLNDVSVQKQLSLISEVSKKSI